MALLAQHEEEHAALLAEVDRFAAERCGPQVARPEQTMAAAALTALLEEAESLGLCGSATDPSGLGPWEGLGEEGGRVGTLLTLERLGAVDVAIAYAIHQRALARAACRRLGFAEDGPLGIAPRGHFGLGRESLGALLRGRPLGGAPRALLGDLYAPDAARLWALDPGMGGVVTPALGDDDRLFFQLHREESLAREDHPNAHGLDSLKMATLRPRGAPARVATDGDLCRAVLAETLSADQLGLLAITVGAVAHAEEAARRFASERRQGGTRIARHAAVRDLLGQVQSALLAARGMLASLGRLTLDEEAVPQVLGARATLTPLLADAANAALQVFGGLGYMRDNGLEKIVRDVNCLRSLGGSPLELRLALAGWEETDV